MILMLHLVFTFQASKSGNIQPKIQTGLFLHPAGKLGALGCYNSPFSLSPFLSLRVLFSGACAREKQYGGDQLHSTKETGGWLGGQEEMTRWRVGSCKFKNISDCRTQGWATAVHQHTLISAIFVAFSIMSEVCLIS